MKPMRPPPISNEVPPLISPEKLAGVSPMPLEQRGRRVDQARGEVAALGASWCRSKVPPLTASRKRRREVARAVVEAEPVEVAAVIGIAELEGGLAFEADAGADLEEGLARHRRGGEVDHAAAELAGIIDRIALLDERAGDHAGREDVERDDAAQRLGARQRRAVEQRQRIAVAEAADEDEAVADDAKGR